MPTRDEELRIRIRLDETGKLTANLGGVRREISSTGKAGTDASRGLKSLTSGLGALKTLLPALGLTGIVAGLKSLTSTALSTAGTLSDVASRTGVGAEAIQEYGFAAEQAGVAAGGFERALEGFAKRVGEARAGTGSLVTILKENDAALLQNVQSASSTEEALDLVFRALANTESAADRAALANAAFGRSGLELLPILDKGVEGLAAMRQRARDLGIVISEDLVNQGDAAGDALAELGDVVRGNLNTALLDAAPAIKSASEGLTSLVGPSVSGLKTLAENADLVGIAFAGMAAKALLLRGIPALLTSINAGMSLVAANPVGAAFVAASVAAIALRGHLRDLQAQIDKGQEAEDAFGRLAVAMKRAEVRGIELTSAQRKAILEGESFAKVFGEIADRTLPDVASEAENTADKLSKLGESAMTGPQIDPLVLGKRFATQIEAAMARAREALEQSGGALTIPARLEIARVEQAIAGLQEQIDRAPDLETRVRLEAELEKYRAQLSNLADPARVIGVDVEANTEPARGTISAYRRDVEAQGATIPVSADTGPARQAITSLFDEINQKAEELLLFGGRGRRNMVNEVTGLGQGGAFGVASPIDARREFQSILARGDVGELRSFTEELRGMIAGFTRNAPKPGQVELFTNPFFRYIELQQNGLRSLETEVTRALTSLEHRTTTGDDRRHRESSARIAQQTDVLKSIDGRLVGVEEQARKQTEGWSSGRFQAPIVGAASRASSFSGIRN